MIIASIIGRMDARMTMPDTDGAGDTATADPSLDRYSGLFASAINDYLRRELNVRDDLPYWFLNGDVGKAWNWRPGIQGSQGYVDVIAAAYRCHAPEPQPARLHSRRAL